MKSIVVEVDQVANEIPKRGDRIFVGDREFVVTSVDETHEPNDAPDAIVRVRLPEGL